jgi:magnesium-transporting ATPase (P-type)
MNNKNKEIELEIDKKTHTCILHEHGFGCFFESMFFWLFLLTAISFDVRSHSIGDKYGESLCIMFMIFAITIFGIGLLIKNKKTKGLSK